MAKSLRQLCLSNLCNNFDYFTDKQLHLPPATKEELFHRLINHDLLTENLLPAITYNLVTHSLQYLDIYGSLQLQDNSLFHIGHSRCRLKSVRIVRCGKVTDQGLAELLINQVCLEILELKFLGIDGSCLQNLSSPETLIKLNLKGCSAVDGNFVNVCCQQNRKISQLNLKGIRNLKNRTFRSIASKLGENMKELNLSECTNIGSNAILALAENCPNLESLKLMSCMNFSEETLGIVLVSCLKIKKLDLSFCSRYDNGFSNKVMQFLPLHAQCLKFCGLKVNISLSETVDSFTRLSQLTSVNLSGFSALSDSLLHNLLSEIGFRLRSLDLGGSFEQITDAGLGAVTRFCENLNFLGLNVLPHLSFTELAPLFSNRPRAENLYTLRFANCTSIDINILEVVVENCRNLKSLDISGILKPKLNDEILCRLAVTCGANLETLFLRGNRCISDISVSELAEKSPNLRRICLSGISQVSDKSVLALANHCHYLQEVYLSGCMMISQAAINYLQDQCYGRVTIYHVVPNSHTSTVLIAKNLDTGEYCRVY